MSASDPSPTLQTFQVQGMSCAHCVRAVSEAVQQADAAARVSVDLPSGRVEVQSARTRDELARAIVDGGYTVAP